MPAGPAEQQADLSYQQQQGQQQERRDRERPLLLDGAVVLLPLVEHGAQSLVHPAHGRFDVEPCVDHDRQARKSGGGRALTALSWRAQTSHKQQKNANPRGQKGRRAAI